MSFTELGIFYPDNQLKHIVGYIIKYMYKAFTALR